MLGTTRVESARRSLAESGREVSCRALTVFFQRLDAQDLDGPALLLGTGYSEAHLRNVAERMDWAGFMTLCRNAGRLWGHDGLEELGAAMLEARWMSPFLALARVLYTPADLYRLLARPKLGGGDLLMSCGSWRLEQVGPRRLLLEFVLQDGYEATPEFLRIGTSMLRHLPTTLGHAPAELHSEPTPSGMRFEIGLPRGGRGLARLGRLASWPWRARIVAQELEDAWEALHRRSEALQAEVRRRRRAEEILQERERRFDLLLERSADFVLLFSPQAELVYVSPSGRSITGYAEEELLGRSHVDLIHADDRDRVLRELEALVDVPWAEAVISYRFRRKDGGWIWLEETARNLLDDPSVAAVVCNARDITERRQLETQLDHAQRMDSVGRLAGGVAHDFNNLLTSIQGFADILGRSLPEEDRRRPHVEGILHSAGRAAELTSQLLAFARKRTIAPRVVDPAELLERVRTLLERVLGDAVRLSVDTSASGGAVEADPGQLEQVVMNLAVNARDAMPAGGALTIDAEDVDLEHAIDHRHGRVLPGEYVRVGVADTGDGMAEPVLDQLFQPFFTTKGPGAGTGLGLSTSWGIVRQAGGHLVVTSRVGRGTRFDIYLPRVERSLVAPVVEPRATEIPGGDETVLLVEDEPMVRTFVDHVLREKGYRVLTASNAAEAVSRLEAAADTPIDLLVTDVRMPGESGTDLARRLRVQRPDLPVLLVTGYADGRELQTALQAERTALLQKPFSARSLAAEVRRLIDGA